MTVDRRALAAVLATLALVAACGGSATQAPGGTQAPGATQTPSATQTPGATQEPGETPESTGPEVSLLPGGAPDLEAMLPAEAGGIKFQKTSFDGSSIPGGLPIGESSDDMAKFLADNGKSLSDVGVALATAIDASAAGSMVMALQVKGVPSDKMVAWVTKDATDAAKTTIGGKEVYGAGAAGFGAYFYVKGDVAFYVIVMGGPEVAADIISKLP